MELPNLIFVNNFMQALNEIIREKLPVKIAFQLVNFLQELESGSKAYWKTRKKILEENGGMLEAGATQYTFSSKEAEKKATEEIEELNKLSQKYNIEPIRLDLSDDIKISPVNLFIIKDIFEK